MQNWSQKVQNQGTMEDVNAQLKITTVQTQIYDGPKDYKIGTSGDRQLYVDAMRPGYAENEFQAIADYFSNINDGTEKTVVLCSDGRLGTEEKIVSATEILIANGYKVIRQKDKGISTTPSASYMIRKHKARLGIILTASHNPGGADGDFGIKFNTSNGAAALPNITKVVSAKCKKTNSYKKVDYAEALKKGLIMEADFVKEYCDDLLTQFDVPALKKLAQSGYRLAIDCNYGSVVETAKYLFEEKLGFKNILWINDKNLPDFGGKKHPNPEPQYSPELMDAMKSGKGDGGFAFDPDADRFMFVGKGGFVLSAQYLGAICLENDSAAFNGRKITGVGSSMPTASAMILVAIRKGIKYFITPTGWKFFSTLMDKLMIQFAQEESRGHSSDHTREKSGPETALRMLQLEAKTGKSIETLVNELWAKDGRVFDKRVDYEKIALENAEELKKLLDATIKKYAEGGDLFGFKVTKAEIYKYTDPTNGEVADNEGWIFYGENNSRLIFRFSGTDTTATMRVYAEKPDHNINATEDEILGGFFSAAEKLTGQKKLEKH